jgi:hypothetical protein
MHFFPVETADIVLELPQDCEYGSRIGQLDQRRSELQQLVRAQE